MGFVIAGFLAVALLVGAIWLTSFLYLYAKERIRSERAKREAERERLLQTPGEPLRCHGCGRVFVGPVTDLGCESCHTSALVIPECQRLTAGASSRRIQN